MTSGAIPTCIEHGPMEPLDVTRFGDTETLTAYGCRECSTKRFMAEVSARRSVWTTTKLHLAIAATGLMILCAGLWLLYPPLALIVGGLVLLLNGAVAVARIAAKSEP